MGTRRHAFFLSCQILTPNIRDVQDHTVAILLFLLLRVRLEAIQVPGSNLKRQGCTAISSRQAGVSPTTSTRVGNKFEGSA